MQHPKGRLPEKRIVPFRSLMQPGKGIGPRRVDRRARISPLNNRQTSLKLFLFMGAMLLTGCGARPLQPVRFAGETMGTTYHIAYVVQGSPVNGLSPDVVHSSVDSLLLAFNRSVSTYIPASVISQVNGTDTLTAVDDCFVSVFNKAQEIAEKTKGAFDVTVMPLVNAWGFGYADPLSMDSAVVDSLRRLVGFRKVRLVNQDGKAFVHKQHARVQVDFSAIAKGYAVDLIGALLSDRGIDNYMVEIGGEVTTRGKGASNEGWKIGIEKPTDDPAVARRVLVQTLFLEDAALATSGNFRNYYYVNGKKVSHEIDPVTGYPAQNNLLSVTVMAQDCMTADALATAFMVMGLDETKAFLKQDTTLEAYLIYSGNNGEMKTWHTPKMKRLMKKQERR